MLSAILSLAILGASMPQDAAKPYVTVVSDNPTFMRHIAEDKAFRTQVRPAAHVNMYSTKEPIYVHRVAKSVPATPLVRVQLSSGQVVYQKSGKDIEREYGGVIRNIISTLRDRCPCKPCSQEPSTAPPPEVEPEPQEFITDEAVEPPAEHPVWLALILGCLGAAAGVISYVRREMT